MSAPRTPQSERRIEDVQGHWLLARVGKRVLRPGGAELTTRMLAHAGVRGSDVVELAPGLGRTATAILDAQPHSYVGVDRDADAVRLTASTLGDAGTLIEGDAAATGLPDASADLVVGEAMLTMQGDRGKAAIVAEAARILRPGGRYAIHELGLTPDDLSADIKEEVRKDLSRTIRVNARPLTRAEWRTLLESAGFEVEWSGEAPMALLEIRRNIADEGVMGTLRILRNVLVHRDIRARVLAMRSAFAKHRALLTGVALIARLPPSARPTRDASPLDPTHTDEEQP